jgi:hypothetical protein
LHWQNYFAFLHVIYKIKRGTIPQWMTIRKKLGILYCFQLGFLPLVLIFFFLSRRFLSHGLAFPTMIG